METKRYGMHGFTATDITAMLALTGATSVNENHLETASTLMEVGILARDVDPVGAVIRARPILEQCQRIEDREAWMMLALMVEGVRLWVYPSVVQSLEDDERLTNDEYLDKIRDEIRRVLDPAVGAC